MPNYDHIILGAGCSGLSLLTRMIGSGRFHDKKILLLDRVRKDLNDRTWCYWEDANKPGYFDHLVHHAWSDLQVRHPQGSIHLQMGGHVYKMIRGIDFYQHCFDLINAAPNVTVKYEEVTGIDAEAGIITCGDQSFQSDSIFSSVLLDGVVLGEKEFYLLQHFRGWWIETDTDRFDPTKADLMNFRTDQRHGCTFLYVLPVSPRRALVEYTLFTEDELTNEEYDEGLRSFIKDEMGIDRYTIHEVENGVIPMTNHRFPQQQGKIVFIGTAGGHTKASTGYTFQFIQKRTAAIVQGLIDQGRPILKGSPSRFRFYDSVLLRVLHERRIAGADVFYRMFQKNKAVDVLRFLDDESSWWQELRIMHSTNKSIFIPAAMRQL